jgi:hypothetical protein
MICHECGEVIVGRPWKRKLPTGDVVNLHPICARDSWREAREESDEQESQRRAFDPENLDDPDR